MKSEKEYKLTCPQCKATFDCTEEIFVWKCEVLDSLRFIEKVKELLNNKSKQERPKSKWGRSY